MSGNKEDVLRCYQNRLERHRKSVGETLTRVRLFRYARTAAGLGIPAILWLAFALHAVSAWLAFLPAVMYLVLDRQHESVYHALNRASRGMKYYERGIARVEGRWMGTGIIDTKFVEPHHIYGNDLDVFGEGSLFELLCSAKTRTGQETLARWLAGPASRDEILLRQQAVEELRNNLDLREDLAVSAPDRGDIDMRRIDEWANAPASSLPLARRLAPILVGLTICALAYSYWIKSAGLLPVTLALEIAFALSCRQRVLDIIVAVREPAAEIGGLYAPLSRLEREDFQASKLRSLKTMLHTDRGTASSQVRWLTGLTAMLDYRHNPNTGLILPLFLWTTQVSFAVEAWRGRHRARIRTWVDAVGELEALCALAGYAYEHPEYPFPQIEEGPPHIEGRDLRHPLLPTSVCVPNSIELGAGPQLLIVSGSNMSGKSTFLRTLGLNIVLALAGAPVPAIRLKCSVMAIGASLRTQDSLRTGTSRFYAEVRRLNDILNHAQQGTAVLFLVDEMLHGTNSHDRVVGAEAVLRALLEADAIGVVTTHDLAIAGIAAQLMDRAANMHFQDRMDNGTLAFDYILQPGIVTRSNAIELMRAAGLRI